MYLESTRKVVTERAGNAGCHVERIHKVYTYDDCCVKATLGRQLRINGKVCVLSTVRKQLQGRRPGGYTRFAYSTLRRVDAIIFHVAVSDYPERTFVVPATTLSEALFSDAPNRLEMVIFVPALEQHSSGSRINLWNYENAWGCLK